MIKFCSSIQPSKEHVEKLLSLEQNSANDSSTESLKVLSIQNAYIFLGTYTLMW